MHGDKLLLADPKDKKYLDKIKTACMHGKIILLQDINEFIDPTLDNVLNKAVIR